MYTTPTNYGTAWDKATCVNTHPMPSGCPVYSTMLPCCKGAYAGQWTRYCLANSMHHPPQVLHRMTPRQADFWYPGERVETNLLRPNDLDSLTHRSSNS